MIDQIRELMDEYATWLKEKTTLREINEWVEITTPYLDRHNDYLQIYARRENGGLLLTDDGYVLHDLEHSGCKLDTTKRRALLDITLNGFGVRQNQNRLEVKATVSDFALRKHNLIQAMLAVSDLFYLAMPVVASLFLEDVTKWLDANDVRYTPFVSFAGKSGYPHQFNFVIPKSRRQPERVVQAITRPSRESAESLAFAWLDTREVRPADSRAYALLNDTEERVPVAVLDALLSYDVHAAPWSKREEIRDELAA